MKIALLGKNDKNRIIEKRLIEEGLVVSINEDLNNINHIRSRDYGFEIYNNEGNQKNDYIIFTEKPHYETDLDGTPNNILLYNIINESIKFVDNNDKPVVFLLDWDGETDTEAVGKALTNSIATIKRKKKVYFLSKTVRTGIDGYEELYNKARNAGIDFIKYETADARYNIDENCFNIDVNDIYGKITIKTDVLAIGGSGKTDKDILKIFNDMRSKTEEYKNKYFFQNFRSTVKGLYLLDGEKVDNDLETIIREIKVSNESSDIFIEVDEGKCAFCNNCFRVCPHSALEQDYNKNVMKPVKYKCQECGECISVCPANAITWINENETSIKGNDLMVFACENSGGVLLDELMSFTKESKIGVKKIKCGCNLKPEDILKEFKEYKKIAIVSCFEGACKHIDGPEKSKKIIAKTKKGLDGTSMEGNKIYQIKGAWASPKFIKESIELILKEGVLE